MTRKGFPFFYDRAGPTELQAEDVARNRDMTLDDLPRAQREGFGPDAATSAPQVSRAERQERAYLAGLS
ncbi:hypothetical protein [Streptomyces cyanogenus]|uniref:Uncharacterized protein n=1 Tax=Streptomyces cyanogenus TaxID=80860 RepID=A0ABX7THX0_STRCY|nr:hypothetical protein [Streptomyces cyanogenus]QTD96050.1 hypothetical protein S1361_01765 [Streptomyces cyanogenus]